MRLMSMTAVCAMLVAGLLQTAATTPAAAQERVVVRPNVADTIRSPFLPFSHAALRRPRVGLALSGGGARAIAQIGVLRVLERHRVPVDFIAGTSFGGVVGGLYAAGWTLTEIESLLHATNWDEVLSLGDETPRTDLFVDQKLARDRSFFVVRFEGLQPVIPPAISSGQRLTDLLSTVAMMSPYRANPSFDDLKIPLRIVTTDLVSGNRVVLREGSLGEALRASVAVPLLFTPIFRDSMQLVDGGLLSNIPVDVVRDGGSDIVIAVNSTSGLREADEMQAPWETADQIMGIMMRQANDLQLSQADVVITPDIGRHLFTDFSTIDSLIAAGERTAEQQVGRILQLYQRQRDSLAGLTDPGAAQVYNRVTVERAGGELPDSLWTHILQEARSGVVQVREIRDHVDLLYATGDYRDVYAELRTDADSAVLRYVVDPYPILRAVKCVGCTHLPAVEVEGEFTRLLGSPVNTSLLESTLENVIRLYRSRGLALAAIDSTRYDAGTGELTLVMDEGVIGDIRVSGGVRTKDWFVRREFPLRVGDVFDLTVAQQGLVNIASTSLFEYVGLDVSPAGDRYVVTLRISERPSQLVRLGVRADNERSLQGLLDVRDENIYGTGMEFGATIWGGSRNLDLVAEYKARRLLDTYLTFNLSGFYRQRDSYLYEDGVPPGENRWVRNRVGEYRTIRYGGSLSFGSQLRRLGNATVEVIAERDEVVSLENAASLEEQNNLRLIRLGTVVDTKNRTPFPTTGVGVNLSYEFAIQVLGGTLSYNALRFSYESYSTFAGWLTFRPHVVLGFADRTMPLSQQFSLGGQESFYGLREDDRRGRQLLLANLELRSRSPVDLIFDTYVSVRYDLGTISAAPEEITLERFQQALGAALLFDTPVGPATLSVGESFYVDRNQPDRPLQWGPPLFSFSIGFPL